MARIAITLHCKRNRIRIFKDVVLAMGDPKYVRLLVNPEKKLLCVQACTKAEIRSFKVPDKNTTKDDRYFFEINSKELIDKIRMCVPHFDEKGTYTVFGQQVPEERLALFDLSAARKSAYKNTAHRH